MYEYEYNILYCYSRGTLFDSCLLFMFSTRRHQFGAPPPNLYLTPRNFNAYSRLWFSYTSRT